MATSTLVELLQERAAAHGDRVAYVFLEDGEREAARWSHAELDRRARAVAVRLTLLSKPGERCMLLYPAGLDFLAGFFGALYAGLIAVPAPPPEASRLKRTAPRLRSIVDDAGIGLVLTNQAVARLLESDGEAILGTGAPAILPTDVEPDYRSDAWSPRPAQPADLAYLQYTSGSTSTPKGVMISHENLVFHLEELQKVNGYTKDSITVSWMPNFHDYGLVEGLLEPLYNGTLCYVMSPFAFVKRPIAWLRALSRYRGTHTQAPNFAYDHCVRRVRPDDLCGLDLSSWRVASNGGELINPHVLTAFAELLKPTGFRDVAFQPSYGLAEATLQVSATPQGESPKVVRFATESLRAHRVVLARASEPGRAIVSCGRVLPSTRVAIVDPESCVKLPPDRVGEVWVSSPAVAQGYWNRPEETEQTFQARLADTPGSSFLRTGDLGFLHEGELFITGRLKDVIIIRGTNHSPQDIEWTVQHVHPALRPENGAAFSVIIDGEERLVIAQELERDAASQTTLTDLVPLIRKAVSESHEVDVFCLLFLARGTLPKTASGKIQRQACRPVFESGGPAILDAWVARADKHGDLPTWLRNEAQSTRTCSDVVGPQIRNGSGGVSHPLILADALASRERADERIAWLREYATYRIHSRLMDERRAIPPSIILDLGNQGLLGMQVPESLGGLGLHHADMLRVIEQLAAIDLNLASLVLLNNTNGIRPILGYAREPLRSELLARLAQGRELCAFALSEPGAGAHVAGVACEARPDGRGGWTLRGIKRWNAASWAGMVNVFARIVEPDGKAAGLTGFVVPQGAPGLRIGPEALTTGLRGSVQGTLVLDGVPVCAGRMLGLPGQGMAVAQAAFNIGRLAIAAAGLGVMKRCAQLMARYASRRQVSTGLLLENPITLARLGQLTERIRLVEALIHAIAAQYDAGQEPPPELPMAVKARSSEYAIEAAGSLMQLLGGRGYMENNIAPQILRDARVLSVGEGPNEALILQVGRRARMDNVLQTWIAAYDRSLAERLGQIRDQVQSRCLGAGCIPPAAAQTWADALLGEVVCDAMLKASVDAFARVTPSRLNRDASAYAAAQFEASVRRACEGTPAEERWLEASEALQRVAEYETSIGDVEQQMPGEEDTLDPLLQRDPSVRDDPGTPCLPGTVKIEQATSFKQGEAPAALDALTPEEKRALLRRVLDERNPEGAPTRMRHEPSMLKHNRGQETD